MAVGRREQTLSEVIAADPAFLLNHRIGDARMKKPYLLPAAALCLSLQASAYANSPFDGTWVADLDTQSGLASDVYLVKDGNYSCATCEPRRSYRADGKPHPIPGDPDVVSESVSITGPRTIVTHIVGPLLDRTTTMTVSADDRTATYISLDHRPGIPGVLRTVYLARRTAPTPTGAHAVSGTWQGVRYVEVPPEVRTTVLRITGDRFSYSTPLGTSFTARIGGDYVPIRSGASNGTTVAIRRSGQLQIEERIKQAGQVIAIRTFTIAPDGRTLEIATADPSRGTTFRAISRRAPAPSN